ncbi:MAG TPA: hypothetical protein VJX47_03290 [Candidatus Sulfotelmatobacter sp.]|nr:hypothetical protein [Candidatus Sulfotelmatobacter sp.]
MRQIHFHRDLTILVLGCMVCTSSALAQVNTTTQSQIQDTGISGLWVLANVSFAGMRAQNNRSVLWRTLAFIFGLPGTIVSFFAVAEGSDRAYGIDLPRRGKP